MKDQRLLTLPEGHDPDVRLELTGDGMRRIWALYSEERVSRAGAAGDGLTLGQWALVAYRDRWLIAGFAVAFAILGFLYVRLATPLYAVGAELLVVPRALISEPDSRVPTGALFMSTQAETIASASVIESALEALPELPAELAASGDPAAAVRKAFTATAITGTNVLSLSYVTPDPVGGARVLDATIDGYRRFVRQVEAAGQEQDLEVLVRRERELRSQLEALEQKFAEDRASSEVIGAEPNSVSIQKDLLERVADQLVAARALRIDLENQLFALRNFGTPGATRDTSRSKDELRVQLWQTEARRAELAQSLRVGHPDLDAVDRQVKALRGELEKSERLERATLERELQAARGNENRLEEIYAREVKKARGIEAERVRQEHLHGELERVAQIHEAALANLRDAELTGAGLAEGRAKVTIHVLERPVPPNEPMWPRPLLVVPGCVLLGSLLGLAVSWLAARRDGALVVPTPQPTPQPSALAGALASRMRLPVDTSRTQTPVNRRQGKEPA